MEIFGGVDDTYDFHSQFGVKESKKPRHEVGTPGGTSPVGGVLSTPSGPTSHTPQHSLIGARMSAIRPDASPVYSLDGSFESPDLTTTYTSKAYHTKPSGSTVRAVPTADAVALTRSSTTPRYTASTASARGLDLSAMSRKRGRESDAVEALKSQVSQLKAEVEEARLLREMDGKKAEIETTTLKAMITKLKRQVKFLTAEAEASRKSAHDEAESVSGERYTLEDKVRKLTEELQESKSDCLLAKQRAEKYKSHLQHARSQRSSSSEPAGEEIIRQLQGRLQAALDKASEVPILKEQLEQARTDTKLSASGATMSSSTREVSKLRRDLETAERRLRIATARLKESESAAGDVPVLRMQLASADEKLNSYREQLNKMSTLEVASSEYEATRRQWADTFKSICADAVEVFTATGEKPSDAFRVASDESITPERVMSAMRSLQDQCLRLIRKKGEAVTSAAKATREAAASAKQLTTLQSELNEAEEKRLSAESEVYGLKRKYNSATNELRGLKSVLQSYDDEIKSFGAGSTSSGVSDSAKEKRIQHLTAQVETLQGQLKEVARESASKTPSTVLAKCREHNRELKDQLDKAQAKASKLQDELARVEAANASMTQKGMFDPSTTKVLHLKGNPASQKKSEVTDKQKERIEALTEQVMVLTEKLAASGGGPGSKDGPVEVVTDDTLKIRHEKLKVLFREKLATYREAVYRLTGYKMTMAVQPGSASRFRLRSQFAEDEDDHLEFLMAGEELQLLETPFCRRIEGKVLAYLSTCHSIPAFLASLTLDLFERQTIMG